MQAYIQSTSNINWKFYIWLSSKLILLLDISSYFIIKVIKLLYNKSKAGTNGFIIYYSHYNV